MAKNEDSNQQDQTRDKILDAAEILFAEGGFDAVSVREITASAGVNLGRGQLSFRVEKGTLPGCFPGKTVSPGQGGGRAAPGTHSGRKNYR